jgi:hypothetical protein
MLRATHSPRRLGPNPFQPTVTPRRATANPIQPRNNPLSPKPNKANSPDPLIRYTNPHRPSRCLRNRTENESLSPDPESWPLRERTNWFWRKTSTWYCEAPPSTPCTE